ncbi:MAG: hypothetical protein H6Q89_164 [Myxococcaceae bacterium]|nr:hypothetical protein [Myxococcaceae bacterium]
MKHPRTWLLILIAASCAVRHVRPVDAAGTPPTHDLDASLEAVLETGRLEGACEAYANGARDEATRLRCGKWMFFRETFGTVGVPSRLLRFDQKHYPAFYGRGFEAMGMIPDPASEDGMPIGLAPGSLSTHAFTCAACHFARLPDGRYAVGAANERLDYGTLIASIGAPLSLSFDLESKTTAPALRATLRRHVLAAKERAGYSAEAGLLGLSLITSAGAQLTLEDQVRFLALAPGTMDFLTPPLLDDGVWTVSRILPLWDLPGSEARARAGMAHEMLSWNGGVHSLMEFIEGFVAIGVGPAWTQEQLIPLRDYIYRLRSPAPVADARVEEGARLFGERGCAKCHDGPHGGGTRVYTFAELETDDAYAKIYAPGPDGYACCGLRAGPESITRGVKAPRLTGLFATQRLLHNGSVNGLEELFCLAPRAADAGDGQRAGGHWMTCRGLPDDEKRALIAYLRHGVR